MRLQGGAWEPSARWRVLQNAGCCGPQVRCCSAKRLTCVEWRSDQSRGAHVPAPPCTTPSSKSPRSHTATRSHQAKQGYTHQFLIERLWASNHYDKRRVHCSCRIVQTCLKPKRDLAKWRPCKKTALLFDASLIQCPLPQKPHEQGLNYVIALISIWDVSIC